MLSTLHMRKCRLRRPSKGFTLAEILIALGILMAAWIVFTGSHAFWLRLKATRGGFFALPRTFLGMHVAHLGVAIFIVGVTLVGGYEQERDVRMEVGDSVEMGRYTFRFDGVEERTGPNYQARVGSVIVAKDGEGFVRMRPEKRIYNARGMPMTEAAIRSNPLHDLYVSLGEPLENGAWSVRIYYKPFVTWIWFGCATMAVGGALSLSDRRYRVAIGRKLRAKGQTTKRHATAGMGTMPGEVEG